MNSSENKIHTTDIRYQLGIKKKITEFAESQWTTGQSSNNIKHYFIIKKNCTFKTTHANISEELLILQVDLVINSFRNVVINKDHIPKKNQQIPQTIAS